MRDQSLDAVNTASTGPLPSASSISDLAVRHRGFHGGRAAANAYPAMTVSDASLMRPWEPHLLVDQRSMSSS